MCGGIGTEAGRLRVAEGGIGGVRLRGSRLVVLALAGVEGVHLGACGDGCHRIVKMSGHADAYEIAHVGYCGGREREEGFFGDSLEQRTGTFFLSGSSLSWTGGWVGSTSCSIKSSAVA